MVSQINEQYAQNDIEIEIRPYKLSYTREQEKYFHAILRFISKETGYTSNELKDQFKKNCGFFKRHWENGCVENVIFSTKELDRQQYSDLINEAIFQADSHNVVIPKPEYMGMNIQTNNNLNNNQ